MTSDKWNSPAPQSIQNPHIQNPQWTTRLSLVFGSCALLGVLLLIFSEVAWSQGFKGGGSAIEAPADPEFDEEFEEFDDEGGFEDPINEPPPPNMGATNRSRVPPPNNSGALGDSGSSGISVGGTTDDKPGPELKRKKSGFALAGPGTEKGIKSKNKIPNLEVDNESGDGIPANKEMITDFNFPDADVLDIAKTLGRLTGKNFLLDKDVKGRVSIISNSPITVSDAWRAFLTTLDMNGLALVPTGKYLRIMRQNDAKGKNVRLYSNSKAPNTDALVTKIFKIKYISAKELENVIRTYANMGARIYGFEQTNTLIITDTGSNIDKIAKMIQFLDVEGFDAGIEVITVKHASAAEISKLIDSLLPGTQANFSNRPGGFGGAGGAGARNNFAARRTKEGGVVNNIIADERTNTLIIHANPKGVEQVRELITRLDRKLPAALVGGKVHVIYLQFADAEEMAKTLNNFSQGSKSGSSGGSFGLPGGPIGGLGVNPNESNLFEGQIKVAADKTTNSLVITASPNDFNTLQRVINKLDIPRDQIYVEIVILEMQMSRNNEYTANILGPKGTSIAPTNDLTKLIINPAEAVNQKGLVLRWADTNTTNVTNPANGTQIPIPNLAALLKAIQTYSKSNILATPQLMTMDNTEALFESTDKIPVPQINNTGLGTSQVTVTKESVPLSIKIKPQLNKISNFIKLDIKAKISDISSRAVPAAVESQAFATLERVAETSVMVSDTDTVVLGGLIRDKNSEVINKVPLLGDIPILGWLFKSRSANVEKSNLLLFITPKIMRQPENVRAVLDKKLKERDEFVERHFGGDDEHREQRNNLIRGLPEVKSITNYNRRRLTDLNDSNAVKEKAKEAAALDQGEAYEGVTPGGQETLTLPPAETIPTTPNAPAPESSLYVPPPSTVATAPGSLPASGGPGVGEAPAMSQPADSNFAPISPGSSGPVSSDPFAPPTTGDAP